MLSPISNQASVDATTINMQRASLAPLTTLKVGGEAELWEVENVDQLKEACSNPFKVLGAGSNLLISDAGVKERVIKLGKSFNNLKAFDTHDFSQNPSIWLGASTPLPGLVRRAAKRGLSGWEGLLGIPAVIGGAIAMNAGTRYGEMADTLEEIELFVNGSLERFPADTFNFSYRHSELPENAIVTRAKFRLSRSTTKKVEELIEKVDAARKGQPKVKSAGCAFKNPINKNAESQSAGKLIDDAGLKGLSVGDAMISYEHGNFIVNLGQANTRDVLALIQKVRQKINVPLELEWQLWGFDEVTTDSLRFGSYASLNGLEHG